MAPVPDNAQGPSAAHPPQSMGREQVNLPFSIAFRISMQGIRKRLARALITVGGVMLGTAFLMAVVTGALIKQAVSAERAQRQLLQRQTALLRAEVGNLEGRRILLVGADLSPAEKRFAQALVGQARAVFHVGGADGSGSLSAAAGEPVDVVVGIGDYAAGFAGLAVPESVPRLAFRDPTSTLTPPVQVLSVAVPDEDARRQRALEAASLARTRWIVGASLLITAIGIANSMLMSVTERIREIGTLKCLGALSSFVVRLFLIESALVGLAGAAAGVALGAAAAFLGWTSAVSPREIAAGLDLGRLGLAAAGCLVMGVLLAIVAGIYPARVAAKMIPASALASHV